MTDQPSRMEHVSSICPTVLFEACTPVFKSRYCTLGSPVRWVVRMPVGRFPSTHSMSVRTSFFWFKSSAMSGIEPSGSRRCAKSESVNTVPPTVAMNYS